LSDFVIHPQLLADCHHLGRLEISHLLLNKNAVLPWFILVPEYGVGDLLDLAPQKRNLVMTEAASIAGFVKGHFALAKINFAAIGNVVPQLHLHVVGRRAGDACWPAPVWGHLRETRDYTAQELATIAAQLARQCNLRRAVRI